MVWWILGDYLLTTVRIPILICRRTLEVMEQMDVRIQVLDASISCGSKLTALN